MTQVNIHEAKTHLSRYVEAVESGAESEVIIARNGRPAAKLVAIQPRKQILRFGLAKGRFKLPDDFDADNEYIEKLMTGEISG